MERPPSGAASKPADQGRREQAIDEQAEALVAASLASALAGEPKEREIPP